MAVKGNKSGVRVLAVLEEIARYQPIGVSQLARSMAEDKSAIQRSIMTLAESGWIHSAAGSPTRWELTGHIHMVAHLARDSSELRKRALPALRALRESSGETVCLNVPDIGRFVVVEVVESRHHLRVAFQVGDVAPADESASGHVVMPYLSQEERTILCRGPISAELEKTFEVTLRQGYYVSENKSGSGSIRVGGSTNIGAPVFDADGRPVGAIVLSAPHDRLSPEKYEQFGEMVKRTAMQLSLSHPAPYKAAHRDS